MGYNGNPPTYFTIEDRNNFLEQLQGVEDHFKQHFQNLTPEDRQKMLKMRDKTTAFVGKAVEYAKEFPMVIPPVMNVGEMEHFFKQAQELDIVVRKIEKLHACINDARMVSANEAYAAALRVYHIFQGAKELDVPGINAALEELGKRFSNRSSNRNAEKNSSAAAGAGSKTVQNNWEGASSIAGNGMNTDLN